MWGRGDASAGPPTGSPLQGRGFCPALPRRSIRGVLRPRPSPTRRRPDNESLPPDSVSSRLRVHACCISLGIERGVRGPQYRSVASLRMTWHVKQPESLQRRTERLPGCRGEAVLRPAGAGRSGRSIFLLFAIVDAHGGAEATTPHRAPGDGRPGVAARRRRQERTGARGHPGMCASDESHARLEGTVNVRPVRLPGGTGGAPPPVDHSVRRAAAGRREGGGVAAVASRPPARPPTTASDRGAGRGSGGRSREAGPCPGCRGDAGRGPRTSASC